MRKLPEQLEPIECHDERVTTRGLGQPAATTIPIGAAYARAAAPLTAALRYVAPHARAAARANLRAYRKFDEERRYAEAVMGISDA